MAKGLDYYPAFRLSLRQSDRCLRSLDCTWSLTDELSKSVETSRIDEPELSQPLCTALQIGLVDLLASWNVRPVSVIGHSSGEIAAAYCSRALSHASAIKVAFLRGKLVAENIKSSPRTGGMISVGLSDNEATNYISTCGTGSKNGITIGCSNSPTNVTLTGDVEGLELIQTALTRGGVFAKRLQVNVAYHSSHMENFALEYLQALGDLTRDVTETNSEQARSVSIFSTVTGDLISPDELNSPNYWARNLVNRVRFTEGLLRMVKSLLSARRPGGSNTGGKDILIEIGPHGALQRPILDTELLGAREQDWNPLRPRWRNLIRFLEHPWIYDHAFGDTRLYPAAGMLVMAIEGARQLADSSRSIHGYQLEEVSFTAGFGVPTGNETLEAQLHFKPHSNISTGHKVAYDFMIFGLVHDSWSQVCNGTVTVQYSSPTNHNGLHHVLVPESELVNEGTALENTTSDWKRVSKDQFYEGLSILNYSLGPTFQNLTDLQFSSSGQATAKIALDAWIEKVDSHPILPHVIHPTDLDALLQSTVLAHSQGSHLNIPVLLPTAIGSLWISNRLLSRKPGDQLRLSTSRNFQGFKDAGFSCTAFNEQGDIFALLDGFRQTSLSLGPTHEATKSAAKRLNYAIRLEPDVEILDGRVIQQVCDKASPDLRPHSDYIYKQEVVSLYFMHNLLKGFDVRTANGSTPSHLQKYMKWVQNYFKNETSQPLDQYRQAYEDLFADEAKRNKWLRRFSHEGPEARLVVETGRHLEEILSGKCDALGLFFSDGLVSNYYESCSKLSLANALNYVDLLAHKEPSLKVLEIGAGTGGATKQILRRLSYTVSGTDTTELDTPRYSQYMFTDISPAFFEEAKVKLGEYTCLEYAVLNIEDDPCNQGFTEEHFDLIVCSPVLHATSNLRVTLKNVRKLLQPDGKLLLVEQTNIAAARTPFVFGLLPGWWLSSEQERKWSPCISVEEWHTLLVETGFNGVQLKFHDHDDPNLRMYSTLISSAIDPDSGHVGTDLMDEITIISSSTSDLQFEVAQTMQQYLFQNKCKVSMLSDSDLELWGSRSTNYIVLLELDSIFFHEINDTRWQALKRLLISAANVLWVTCGCGPIPQRPMAALAKGFSRTPLSEHPEINFIDLTIEEGNSTAHIVALITKLYEQVFPQQTRIREPEYVEVNGMLCIPRLVADTALNRRIHDNLYRGQHSMQEFSTDSRALDLTIESPGLLETLRFKDDLDYEQPIAPSEVEIEVKATGVNFKDVMLASGLLAGDRLGFECAGIVTRVGIDAPFRPGDRVCGCALKGAYKTFARMDSSAVIHIPARLSFAEGAAVPMGFATAYYSLVTLANLQEGESVLIHSGAGGVGQAAIQIAQRLKARIYTSVGTEEKKRLLIDRYNIPIEHIFNSRTDEFAHAILSKTGTGVDVVLNSLSGDQQLKSWKCIAPLGRFIELGKADMVESQRGLPMGPFLKNVTFSSVSLDVVMAKSTATMRKIMRAVDHMFADAVNPARVPFPLHKYTVGQIEQALRFMQGGKSSGKIVIEMSRSDQVAVLRSSKPSYSFDSNATYVIAGGLGGLGRSIIEWMVSRNAKNFLVLTRSGASNNEAAMRLIKRMREAGVKIEAPCCDITDDAKVAFTLGQSIELLPPVRGCIQATMVLQDGLLEQMTAASFNEALRPKTLGTINLARNLPESLDFFVLLSSIASVTGSRAQANYAAANAFQDAFARQRVASGQHCVSLNLGAILSVGYAAERNLAQSLRQSGFEGVQEAEFLALLDYACDPECVAAKQPQTAQIVSGLASAETLPGEQFRSVYWAMKPMFKGLRQLSFTRESSLRGTAGVGNDAAAQVAPSIMLASAPNKVAAVDIVKNALANRFSTLMAIALSDIDTRKAVSTFGIDSLVSLELKTWIAREFKADTSVLDILGAAGIEDLAMTVVKQSKLTMELKNDIEVDG